MVLADMFVLLSAQLLAQVGAEEFDERNDHEQRQQNHAKALIVAPADPLVDGDAEAARADVTQNGGGADVHFKAVQAVAQINGQDLGNAGRPERLKFIGAQRLHGLKRPHIDGLDALVQHLGYHAEGKHGDGHGAGKGAQPEDQRSELGDNQRGQGTDQVQQEAAQGHHNAVAVDVGGGNHGKGQGQRSAQHGAQNGHLDGIHQRADHLGQEAPVGLEDLLQNNGELMTALDQNAEIKSGQNDGSPNGGDDAGPDQRLAGAGALHRMAVGKRDHLRLEQPVKQRRPVFRCCVFLSCLALSFPGLRHGSAVVNAVQNLLRHVGGGAVVDDLAGADTDDAGGVFQGQIHMVNVDQHRNIHFFVDALEVAHDLMGGHGVQRGHGLVGQNDGGVLVQGAGQRHALLLAAGKLVAAGIGLVQNAHLIQRLQGLQLLLSGKNAEQNPEEVHIGHHGGKHVFDGGGAGNQVEGLKDHADFAAEAIDMTHGLKFEVREKQGRVTPVEVNYQGFYNIYNILAAYSAARTGGLELAHFEKVLQEFNPQNGRMEHFTIGTTEVVLNLAKNPAGFNQNISAVMEDKREKDLIIVINDNAQDGTDVSWLWDVDFDRFKGANVNSITVSGIRCQDMRLRMKYVDIPSMLEADVEKAIRERVEDGCGNLYVLVNYTALFSTRNVLKKMEEER